MRCGSGERWLDQDGLTLLLRDQAVQPTTKRYPGSQSVLPGFEKTNFQIWPERALAQLEWETRPAVFQLWARYRCCGQN